MAKKKGRVNPAELPSVEQLLHFLLEAEKVADKARRTKKSLTGNNPYAEKFYDYKTGAIRAFRDVQSSLAPIASQGLERTLSDIETELSHFYNPKTLSADRRDLRRHLEMLAKTEIEPAFKPASAHVTEFIPLEIVDRSRNYVVNIARQVNRCFQHDCFDACGVMVRRLLETLIIEVFEAKGIASKIRDTRDNYLMFADLVGRLINTTETPVGKTTRKELPNVAIVLNNCAHSRTFNISRSQLLQYQTFIVIAAQELMTLWEVRKSKT